MDGQMRQRGLMALTGGLAGLGFHILALMFDGGVLEGRAMLFAATFAVVFAAGALSMAGPLRLGRALLAALPVALLAAVLLAALSTRFAWFDAVVGEPIPMLASMAVAFLPLPFLIAQAGPGGWRDYPTLFFESWAIVVRTLSGGLFTGLVWGLIWLSDALLGIVGLDLIDWIVGTEVLPWVLTGAVYGLALAVVAEMSDVLSPQLALRLLRLLVIPVLAVTALFVVALPLRGTAGLDGVPVALTLLLLAAASATLVTTAVERSDDLAVQGAVMRRAVQALALLLPVPAGLGAYAVAVRVMAHGWTPERLFASLIAALALAYGIAYALAVIRGAGWMGRIRQANITLALVLLGMAALWQTPLFNAEALSARDHLARYEDGRISAAQIDLGALDRWGNAGQEARARLAELAADPARADLARALAAWPDGGLAMDGTDAATLRAALVAQMPLQPPGATATRDILLSAIPDDELRGWSDACAKPLSDGRPGCVFVIADFWPDEPGEEGLVILREPSGYLRYEGLGMLEGQVQRRSVWSLDGLLPDFAEGEALIARLQDAPAALSAAPLNRIGTGPDGRGGLILMP